MPAPGESPDGPDRQAREVELADPYDLGAEFYRWEFATAVAGAILEINPFDQPNVQLAKDKTNEVLAAGNVLPPQLGGLGRRASRAGEAGRLRRHPGLRRPGRGGGAAAVRRADPSQTDCVVTVGLGPRYLHSTGQLHKGGRRPAASCRSWTGSGRRSVPSPVRNSASGRSSTRRRRQTSDAEGARPPGRARPTGGNEMNLGMVGLGRMGGEHDRAAAASTATRSRRTRARIRSARRLAGRARRQARPPARRLAHDPGGRSDRERLPDARAAARGWATSSSTAATRTSATRSGAPRWRRKGIHFLDAGVSGGVWGLKEGYCIMVGGTDRALRRSSRSAGPARRKAATRTSARPARATS